MKLLRLIADEDTPHKYRGSKWSSISAEAKAFVDGCLHKAPEQRWDVQRVLEDEWLQDRATATPDAEDLTENAAHVRKMQLQRFRGAVNTVRATVRINAALGARSR